MCLYISKIITIIAYHLANFKNNICTALYVRLYYSNEYLPNSRDLIKQGFSLRAFQLYN